MISKKLVEEVNKQINKELYSMYLYRSMSHWLQNNNFPGMGKWMSIQGKEENEHAEKFEAYLNDVGAAVVLEAIEKPATTFKSPLEIFEKSVEHEKFITASINNLYAIALKDGDYASAEMLNWFVKEQVEEEKNPTEILAKLKMIGEGHNGALLYIDKELGKRGKS